MTKFFLTGAALFGALTLGAATGHATVFSGTSSFTDTGNGQGGSGVNFTNVLNSPFATTSLTAGGGSSTYINTDFVTVTGTGTSTGTDTVSLVLSFTQPGAGTDDQTGSAKETVNGSFSSGTVTWNGASGGFASDLVSFGDGAEAQVEIFNTTLTADGRDKVSGQVEVKIIDLADPTPVPTPVPEPSSLVLLASALSGIGFIGHRHIRKRACLA